MLKPTFLTLLLIVGLFYSSNAQTGPAHEIGFIAGPIQFRSDYGQRNNTDTNLSNTGFGIGIVDYLNFSSKASRDRFFGEHFRFRSELSYSKTNLQHYGEWVEKTPPTKSVEQLKAMRGTTKMLNLGFQLEFTPIKIHDFENTDGGFSPYASLGFQISYYSAKAASTLGSLGNPTTTYPKYLVTSDGHPHGYASENKAVLSVVSSVGTRYKLNSMSDLLLDLRFQYFNSDWVDGLNPNREVYTENKSNDALLWLNLGYIFYLEF